MIFYTLLALAGVTFLVVLWTNVRDLRSATYYRPGWLASIAVGTLWGLLGAFVTALIGTIIFVVLAAFVPSGDIVTHKTPLRALGNSQSPSGHFFLGSGTIDSEAYYTYITQRQDGGYQVESIQADNAVIYEDVASEGYLTTYTRVQAPGWLAPFPVEQAAASRFMAEIHIPEGSIQLGYNVDVTK